MKIHLLPDSRTEQLYITSLHQNTSKMITDLQHFSNSRATMLLSDSGIESSPEINSNMNSDDAAPMSRTHQYRKVMKPLLERKRRARINKCLDDLKDIMVNTLQAEGESITKLEKADVLELTVKHLRKLKHQNALGLTPQATYAGRFRAGYSQCAQEVSKFMSSKSSKGIEPVTSARLLGHLANCLHTIEAMPPSVISMATSPPMASPQPMASPPAHQMAPPPPPQRVPSAVLQVHDENKPLDLIKPRQGKENYQVQDLSMKSSSTTYHSSKSRPALVGMHGLHSQKNSWRPW